MPQLSLLSVSTLLSLLYDAVKVISVPALNPAIAISGTMVTVAGSASVSTLYVPETEVPTEMPRILRLLESYWKVPSSLNSIVALFCESLHLPTMSLSIFAPQPAKAQTIHRRYRVVRVEKR